MDRAKELIQVKKTILYVAPGPLEIPSLRGGGKEEQEFQMARSLSGQFKTIIISPTYWGRRGSLAIGNNLEIRYINFPAVRHYPSRNMRDVMLLTLMSPLYSFAATMSLLHPKYRRVDWLVVADSLSGIMPSILARVLGIPVIYREGNLAPWIIPWSGTKTRSTYQRIMWGILKTGSCFIAGIAARTIVDNEIILTGMTKAGIDTRRLRVIHPGVDTEAFSPLVSSPSARHFKVGFIGRLTDEKGAALLLQLCSLAVSELPELRFIIMGDGPFKKYLSELPNVEHVGSVPRNELPVWISRVDALVFFQRALGLGELEALACGKSLLTLASSQANKFIRDLESGLVCEANPQSYLDGVRRLVSNPALVLKYSSNARQTAVKFFDQTITAHKWEKALLELEQRAQIGHGTRTRS
ncbi:MAG: glycosyltransferase [Nitrososphaerales archaeon]